MTFTTLDKYFNVTLDGFVTLAKIIDRENSEFELGEESIYLVELIGKSKNQTLKKSFPFHILDINDNPPGESYPKHKSYLEY